MSTEMENSSIDLEQLLRTKSWEQLSDAERTEMMNVVSGREEYMRMFAMTNQLMSGSGVHDEELKPSENTRQNLMNAFVGEQRKRRAAWWTSLWYNLSDKLRFDIPIVRIAVAAVLLLAGVFGVAKMMEKSDEPQIVKTEPVQSKDESTPQNPTPDNNVAVEPSNNGAVVNPDQQIANDSLLNLNVPQIAIVDQDMNQNAIIPDSTPQYITAFTNNGQPLIVDSNTLVLPTATFNLNNVNCSGSSNGTVIVTNAGTPAYTFQWTPTNNATVIGLPARSRSLENDSEVLDVFFSVK